MRARPTRDGDELVHQVADAALPAVRIAWIEALAAAVSAVGIATLIREMGSQVAGNVVAAVGWQSFQNSLATAWTPTITDVVRESWQAHVRTMTAEARVGFGVRNAAAESWALKHAAELVTEVSAESQQAVRYIVVDALERGLGPREAAKRIRAVIGLNLPQAKAYAKRAAELADAVKAGTIKEEVAAARLMAYRRTQIIARADLIARTETMRAANTGKQLLWEQAAAEGRLPADPKRKWVVTPDERLCAVCEPIPAKGPVGLREPFEGGNGVLYNQPPAHPQCRCTMVLVL